MPRLTSSDAIILHRRLKPAGHRSSNCTTLLSVRLSKMASSTFLPFLSPSIRPERERENSVIDGDLDRSSSPSSNDITSSRRNLSLSLSLPASSEILFVRDLMLLRLLARRYERYFPLLVSEIVIDRFSIIDRRCDFISGEPFTIFLIEPFHFAPTSRPRNVTIIPISIRSWCSFSLSISLSRPVVPFLRLFISSSIRCRGKTRSKRERERDVAATLSSGNKNGVARDPRMQEPSSRVIASSRVTRRRRREREMERNLRDLKCG